MRWQIQACHDSGVSACLTRHAPPRARAQRFESAWRPSGCSRWTPRFLRPVARCTEPSRPRHSRVAGRCASHAPVRAVLGHWRDAARSAGVRAGRIRSFTAGADATEEPPGSSHPSARLNGQASHPAPHAPSRSQGRWSGPGREASRQRSRLPCCKTISKAAVTTANTDDAVDVGVGARTPAGRDSRIARPGSNRSAGRHPPGSCQGASTGAGGPVICGSSRTARSARHWVPAEPEHLRRRPDPVAGGRDGSGRPVRGARHTAATVLMGLGVPDGVRSDHGAGAGHLGTSRSHLGNTPEAPSRTRARATRPADNVEGAPPCGGAPSTSCPVRHWRRIRDSNS